MYEPFMWSYYSSPKLIFQYYICFQVPCQLQYWNVLERRFDTYCEFSLSENEATDVTLPEVTADFNPDLVISGIWRLLVLHPDGNQSPEG